MTSVPATSDLWNAAKRVMELGELPGIVVAVARGDGDSEHVVLGTDARGRPLAADSLFPVASITKLATALAILRLVERGALALADLLDRHLPAAAAAEPGVTVRTLLCHVSGVTSEAMDEEAPYGPDLTWDKLSAAALRAPIEMPPRSRVAYTGAGYVLLGILIERAVSASITTAVHELVLDPLGIEAYFGEEPPRAPVAIGGIGGPTSGTEIEEFNSAHWRSIPDPGGSLLTTAAGAIALCRAFRGLPDGFISSQMCAEATRDQTGGLSGGLIGIAEWPLCPWGLGPMLHNPSPQPLPPASGGPGSFGHTGYSLGYVWSSPAHDVTWTVFGPRTYDNGWPISHGPLIDAAVLGIPT